MTRRYHCPVLREDRHFPRGARFEFRNQPGIDPPERAGNWRGIGWE